MNLGIVHVFRHAEGIHNTRRDTTILDPELSPNGLLQARELRDKFPFINQVGIVMTSPLRRTLQTTIEGFGDVLDRVTFLPESSITGIDDGTRLLLEPNLQAHSARPCDTGSAVPSLREFFPGVSLAGLASDWHIKESVNAPDDESLHKRAHLARQHLIEKFNELAKLEENSNNPRRDIVIVGHGGFSKYLMQDEDFNVPGATWRTFRVLLSKESDITFEEMYIQDHE
jgi:broad specificity phosphatase PhoE